MRETIRAYDGPYPTAKLQLEKALCVMVQAYLAATIRQEAEWMLRELTSD